MNKYKMITILENFDFDKIEDLIEDNEVEDFTKLTGGLWCEVYDSATLNTQYLDWILSNTIFGNSITNKNAYTFYVNLKEELENIPVLHSENMNEHAELIKKSPMLKILFSSRSLSKTNEYYFIKTKNIIDINTIEVEPKISTKIFLHGHKYQDILDEGGSFFRKTKTLNK